MIESIISYIEEELSEMTGSAFVIKSKSPVGGGCINQALKLETSKGAFFLKWNFSCPDDLFIREAEGLRELRLAAGEELAIPEVILAKEAGELAGFIVMEFLESGHSAQEEEQLGRGIAHLHRVRKQEYGFGNDNFCGQTLQMNAWKESWVDFFAENRLGFLIRLIQNNRPLPGSDFRLLEQLIERLPVLLPDNPGASLIHGDLWSGNHLYSLRGPALIDPAVSYAHREMELSMMQLFGGFSSRTWSAYREAFPLESGWEDRVQLYQIFHILNHYYLFGGSYGRQAVELASRFL